MTLVDPEVSRSQQAPGSAAAQHRYQPRFSSFSSHWQDFITPSTLHLAPLVELLLRPVDMSLRADLRLGLQEVLVNAVCHGNAMETARLVRIRRVISPDWFFWSVRDEGQGFPRSLRFAGLPDTLGASHGRGLFLIQHCFDAVRWNSRGNMILVAKRRPGPGPGSSLFDPPDGPPLPAGGQATGA